MSYFSMVLYPGTRVTSQESISYGRPLSSLSSPKNGSELKKAGKQEGRFFAPPQLKAV
jgi:hypothetical protein